MGEAEVIVAAGWTDVLLAWGPGVGGVALALSLIFASLIVWISRGNNRTQIASASLHATAIQESTRLNGRVQHESSRAITSLSRNLRRIGEGQSAMMQALLAQPARYALEKAKAADGGWSREELEDRRRQVQRAEDAATSAANWTSDDRPSGDPEETIEDRIRRLRTEAELASSPERADELVRRAMMLEAELTAQVRGGGLTITPSPE